MSGFLALKFVLIVVPSKTYWSKFFIIKKNMSIINSMRHYLTQWIKKWGKKNPH